MKQKTTKLSCDTCGGEVVYVDASGWDNHQAHQRLHREGCAYKAKIKVHTYKKDDVLNGVVLHKAGDPYMTKVADADGKEREIPYEYLPQWDVCDGIPLRTELV